MIASEGMLPALYSGFVPMLFKQIPYTIAKFVVQDFAQESIYNAACPKRDCGGGTKFGISLTSGVIAGVGPAKLCLMGLPARCVMIGGITAGQFGIFDTLLPVMGVAKFHFHNPAAHH